MKEKIKNLCIISAFSILIILILLNSEIVTAEVLNGINIWLTKILPSLLPFFIITDLLINYNFIYYLAKIFNKSFQRLFRVSGNSAFIFFLSILTGSPSNAKYTKELLLKGFISLDEADFILSISFFTNPLFLITFSNLIFNNSKITIIILIINYLSNIIVGIITRNKYSKNNLNNSNKSLKFINTFSNSINKSFTALFLILGIVISFIVLNSLIVKVFNLNFTFKLIIGGFLEITQGLSLLSTTNINYQLKLFLFMIFISFGGLSINMQIKSIIADTNISYKRFFKARIYQVLISVILLLIASITSII